MARLLNIMHLRASNFVGGPEKQILEHFGRIDKSRFRMVLGTYVNHAQEDQLGDEANRRGFNSIRLNAASPFNPSGILDLVKVIKLEDIDIICTHGYKPNVLGYLASKFCGIRTIAISRGWTWESPKIRFYEAIDRFFLRFVDHIVAVSAGQREKILVCGVAPEKVTVIHNAINIEECHAGTNNIKQELGLPEGSFLVVSAGRLSPEKNYAAMIEAAKIAVSHNSSLFFAIFGEGFLRADLEKKINDVGLKGRFFLPGFKTNIQAVLASMDIFMLPSFTEGLPNVALEAFANKKPIVATKVGGTPEVVQDGVSGFLTTPEQPELMAKHLLKLCGDDDLRRKMGEAGYSYIKEHFGFDAQTAEYEKLYSSLNNSRNSWL